ncbi:MAG: hypothetical protein ACXVI9_12530 [Mucilaginibacter sp.]
MKNVLLIVLMVAGTSQLKAQQLQTKPLDSALLKSPQLFQNLKPNDDALLKNYFKVQPNQSLKDLGTLTQAVNAIPFGSTMPVAKLTSPEKMPIAKLGDPNTHYTMLIKRVKAVDPLKPQLVSP